MLLWAQGVYTEILVCICLVNWEIHMKWSWIELLAMQHMPTLPEQSSYLTCRPQKGSVFPRLGWTWRSTVPSCWWSGRYIGLWRGANWKSELQNNPQWFFRKVHSSCLTFKDTDCNFQCYVLCPCRQRQLSRNTENSALLCTCSAEVNHYRNDAATTAGVARTGN